MRLGLGALTNASIWTMYCAVHCQARSLLGAAVHPKQMLAYALNYKASNIVKTHEKKKTSVTPSLAGAVLRLVQLMRVQGLVVGAAGNAEAPERFFFLALLARVWGSVRRPVGTGTGGAGRCGFGCQAEGMWSGAPAEFVSGCCLWLEVLTSVLLNLLCDGELGS